MPKRIEVYFILYLGLLMAFFGIDSEVADYIKNQERILEQVAKSKLKNLISIQNQHLNNVGDEFNLSFDLQGNFDKDSLNARLFFKNDKNDSDTFSVSLEKDLIGGTYSALVKESRFDSLDESYSVQITYEVKPYFSDSSRAVLLLEFGKKELVDEIIRNIYSEGSIIEDTLTVGLTITPNAKDQVDIFVIKPIQNPLNSIRGLNGKIGLFVGGVKRPGDYTLRIESDRGEYENASIRQGLHSAEINLGSLRRNGEVRVIGRRSRDGKISRPSIRINIIEPRWKYPDRHRNEIYFNSPFTFDATLFNFDHLDDIDRYSLKVTGLIKENVRGNTFDFDGSLKSAGKITIQLYIDDNNINGMSHEIMVKKPPPPDIKYLDRDGRFITLEVNAYGRGNKITKLRIHSGGDTHGNKEISDHEQGQTYTQKVKLKESANGRIKLKTSIYSNYSDVIKKEQPIFTIN